MAGGTLLALLDDVATILDDVAAQTGKAASKTMGIAGDDLALNAKQLVGIDPDKELPIVWKVTKGSLINKAILVPCALLISAFMPFLIVIMLMIGGLYLCFEGAEKVLHDWMHRHDPETVPHAHTRKIQNAVDPVKVEKKKIRGAIRTDFILSAEIITIALGAIVDSPLSTQIPTLIIVALVMTVGIYGAVAAIVKLDDLGLYLMQTEGTSTLAKMKRKLGKRIVNFAPKFMKFLALAGTVAMFLVGGGIIMHNVPVLEHAAHDAIVWAAHLIPMFEHHIEMVGGMLINGLFGLAVGVLAVYVFNLFKAMPFVSKVLKKNE